MTEIDEDQVTVIQVDSDSSATQVIEVPDTAVQVVGLPGNGGSTGGGSVNPIVDWFTGIGEPPDALIGAGPGDMYIDLDSGILYQLR